MITINKNLTAIILCGGKGERLRPITNNLPNPLIEIKNKPILFYIIEHLKKYGIKDYIIATGYKSEKIEEYMADEFKELSYEIINSGDVDILSRVKACIKHVTNDAILCYGDTISNINIDDFIKFHDYDPSKITISSYPITIPFGVMTVDENHLVKKFEEKPTLNKVMNIGYYYLSTKHNTIMHEQKDLLSFIDALINNNQLKCYQHKGIHITINTIAELSYAEDNIEKIF